MPLLQLHRVNDVDLIVSHLCASTSPLTTHSFSIATLLSHLTTSTCHFTKVQQTSTSLKPLSRADFSAKPLYLREIHYPSLTRTLFSLISSVSPKLPSTNTAKLGNWEKPKSASGSFETEKSDQTLRRFLKLISGQFNFSLKVACVSLSLLPLSTGAQMWTSHRWTINFQLHPPLTSPSSPYHLEAHFACDQPSFSGAQPSPHLSASVGRLPTLTSNPTMTSTLAVVPVEKLQLLLKDSGDKQVNVLHTMQLQNKKFQATLTDLYRHFPHPSDKDPNFHSWSGEAATVLLCLYKIEESCSLSSSS